MLDLIGGAQWGSPATIREAIATISVIIATINVTVAIFLVWRVNRLISKLEAAARSRAS